MHPFQNAINPLTISLKFTSFLFDFSVNYASVTITVNWHPCAHNPNLITGHLAEVKDRWKVFSSLTTHFEKPRPLLLPHHSLKSSFLINGPGTWQEFICSHRKHGIFPEHSRSFEIALIASVKNLEEFAASVLQFTKKINMILEKDVYVCVSWNSLLLFTTCILAECLNIAVFY